MCYIVLSLIAILFLYCSLLQMRIVLSLYGTLFCLIQDLTLKKLIGVGEQSNEVYYFNKNAGGIIFTAVQHKDAYFGIVDWAICLWEVYRIYLLSLVLS